MLVCRVCLVSDRVLYLVANTSLENTYDRMTADKLQRGEWPATMCGVCVAMLRRCRRFAETAREANAALDHWYRGKADAKLTPTPLLTLVRSATTFKSADLLPPDKFIKDEDDPLTSEKIYSEVPVYYAQSYEDPVSDDEKDDKTLEKYELLYDRQGQPGTDDEVKYTDPGLSNLRKITSDNLIKEDKKSGPAAPQTTRSPTNADAETKTLFSNTDSDYTTDDPISQNPSKDSKEELFACDKCKFTCKSESALSAHNMKHNEYICDTCGKKLKLRGSLIRHIISCHTDDKPLACNKCGFRTKYKNSLRLHDFVRHSGLKPFSCDVCSFRCNSKQNLRRHAYTHGDFKPYFCEVCGFRSIQLACLKKHMRKHKEKRKQFDINKFTDEAAMNSYVCHICDKGNDSKEALQAHLLLHTGDKPHICDYCDNRFATKKALKLHSFIHTGRKLYVCDVCGQSFGKKDALKTHKVLHTGEKPYECNICNAKFARKGGLKTHLFKHTDEKPYACDKCDYRATLKAALKTHLLNHTGVKLYACDKCDHRCNSKSNLNRHLMKHTGIKHLMCDKCNYRTGNRDSFKYHLATHTAEKRYGCEKCDYRCMDKRSLMSHLRKHTS